MKFILLCTLLLSTLALAKPEVKMTGKIYTQGSNRSDLLFNLKREEEKKGPVLTIHGTFTDPQGAPAFIESATLNDGKVIHFKVEQKQLGEEGLLEVRDGKLHFSYTKDGKTETDTEDEEGLLIIGPTTIGAVQAHWDLILKGDDLKVRYASLDRKETVGFKFFKKSEDDKTVRIEMKPTSFVIAAIVKPLTFVFAKESKRLLELHGRVPPKKRDGSNWKDLDAEVTYQYP